MDYLISKVILMVSGIAMSRGRHYAFALLYFYIWALYKLCSPEASRLGLDWYWLCISGEAVIIFCAVAIKPNAKAVIIAASTVEIIANSFSIYSDALHDFYPYIIRSMEIAQLLTIILWSSVSLSILKPIHIKLKQWGDTWMLKLYRRI